MFGNKIIYISEYGNNMYIVDVSTLKRWDVTINEQVMSDVSCNLCPMKYVGKKELYLMIAFSAQHTNGRKRIFIKMLSME